MTQIFDKYPKQWGLRGDPFLWAELQAHFKSNAVPKSVDEFRAQLEILIQQLTGCDLDSDEAVFVPRYDAGGMSSGHVSPEFWREIAIPLLCKRFEKTERSSVVSTHRLAHPQDTNSKCKTLIQVTLEDVQMSHNHADASTILIKNIETLGKRFRNEHLGGWDTKKLESD